MFSSMSMASSSSKIFLSTVIRDRFLSSVLARMKWSAGSRWKFVSWQDCRAIHPSIGNSTRPARSQLARQRSGDVGNEIRSLSASMAASQKLIALTAGKPARQATSIWSRDVAPNLRSLRSTHSRVWVSRITLVLSRDRPPAVQWYHHGLITVDEAQKENRYVHPNRVSTRRQASRWP